MCVFPIIRISMKILALMYFFVFCLAVTNTGNVHARNKSA